MTDEIGLLEKALSEYKKVERLRRINLELCEQLTGSLYYLIKYCEKNNLSLPQKETLLVMIERADFIIDQFASHQPTGNTDNIPTRKQNLIEGTVTLSVDFVDFSFCFLRLMNFRYRKINSIFDISICLIYFMREYLWIITVLVLSACIAIPFVIPFASFSISGEPNLVMNLDEIVYAVPFLALFVLAGMLLIKLKKHYLFVCGECDRCFLTEKDLRKHYGTIHIKKDSKEKKD